MRRLILQRMKSWGDEGTPGLIWEPGRPSLCFTVELPWRENAQSVSCIPEGVYPLRPWSSERFPRALGVRRVEGRSAILIHPGNWAGDKSKGLRSDSYGCILPCEKLGIISGQKAGMSSRSAMEKLLALDPQPTEIEVRDWDGGGTSKWRGVKWKLDPP